MKKGMKKLKDIWLLPIAVVFVFFIVGGFILLFQSDGNKEEVNKVVSIIANQSALEKDFTTFGYTIDSPNVILNPYEVSPLTALVLFETEQAVSPKVTIVGKDELSTFTHTFESSKQHFLPIYGLYADYSNEVIIEYSLNDEVVIKTLKIETAELPSVVTIPTSVTADRDKLTNDLYFYTPSSEGYTCAYDINGDVRWYLETYALWEIDRLENGHILLSTGRLINPPYYMTGLYEMDLLGKIYQEYSIEGGYHHEYVELPNGNLLVGSNNFDNNDGTVEDYLVELDRQTGEAVKTFDMRDILKMDDGKNENWSSYDWFHNNSFFYDEDTNSIVISGRHQDAIVNISYDTGELNWIIGDPTGWSNEYQKYFFTPIGDDFEWQWSQHAVMVTPEGYIFVFDNGNNKSKNEEEYVDASESYSRGVIYKIDTTNMTIEQVWEYGKERGSSFYSPYISDVDYLEENHYIVHSGGIVYVDGKNSNQSAGIGGYDRLVTDTVEILNDEVIFEMILPANTYRVEKMSMYGDNEKFQLTAGKRVGSLGVTKVSSQHADIRVSSTKIDEEYDSHDITYMKETDRLVVQGRFQKGTSVKVMLYQDLVAKYYSIRVSKTPYTALCLDIFSQEEDENGLVVTKYINSEGLTGRYSIYFEIDGTLYNTGKYVEF